MNVMYKTENLAKKRLKIMIFFMSFQNIKSEQYLFYQYFSAEFSLNAMKSCMHYSAYNMI